MKAHHGDGAIARGVGFAALAALLFGATTPFIKRASGGIEPLVVGALLYLGASAESWLVTLLRGRTGARWTVRGAGPRLALIALVGAAAAPALLVAGLARTDAATASLLLALEAPFTLLLARAFLGEHLGRRVLVAATLIFAAAALLAAPRGGHAAVIGGALVAASTLAWATDNLLSRALADDDPVLVVAWKGLLGAAASTVTALALAERAPPLAPALAMLGLGAVGYGVSLQLYLRAQSVIGAARTASVFAAGPFVGAAVALLAGAPAPGPRFFAASALMLAGVWLHLSERHAHAHAHEAIDHEHVHTHDDLHHDHRHDPMPEGAHSHRHHHDALSHTHAHGEDLHHRHEH